MRPILTGSMLAAAVAGAALLAFTAGAQQGGPAELRPVHVEGKTIAPGVRMTVHVFHGRKNGPKGPPSPSGDACLDADQSAAPLSFGTAPAEGMAFATDSTFAPEGFTAAIGRSFAAWNDAVGALGGRSPYFSASPDADAPDGPRQDGRNVVGWARLVPRNVLAAAWTYTDANDRVLEADVFFNTSQKWSVLTRCNEVSRFDIENVGTHELGHVLALDHVSDAGKQATMYPSAPAGEIRKRTLTEGDRTGLAGSLGLN